MKPSFYFVVWIVIYPLLSLFHSRAVDEYAFLVALIFVGILAYTLNLLMSKTIEYEKASAKAQILEDIYNSNVAAFKKRLSTDSTVRLVTAIYFMATTVVIIGDSNTYVAGASLFIVFLIFSIITTYNCFKYVNAESQLKTNPTPDECQDIAQSFYDADYTSYYDLRSKGAYEDTLPPKPRHYMVYTVISIVAAVLSAFLGLLIILVGILLIFDFASSDIYSVAVVAMILLLYGSLAAYYGVRDFLSCLRSKRVSALV